MNDLFRCVTGCSSATGNEVSYVHIVMLTLSMATVVEMSSICQSIMMDMQHLPYNNYVANIHLMGTYNSIQCSLIMP